MDLSRRGFLAGTAGLAAFAVQTKAVSAASQAGVVDGGVQNNRENAKATGEPFTVRAADGTMLAGEAYGEAEAPEILFIHGLRQSRLSWEKQFADSALAGFRMVGFDLRGHGDSDKPTLLDAYSDADRWADDVAAVIDATRLRNPVLVGWSLGGYVAGAYLRRHGGSGIAGVNLVDGVTKLSPDLLTEEARAFTRTTTSHDLAERTAATADFLAACFHQLPAPSEMQRMLVVNGMTSRAVNEGFVRTATIDLEPVFAAYAGPILLTHGVHDRLVRVAMSERIKAIHKNSRLSLYENSGHSPFYEEPARYGQELAAFVKAANGD
ncbi:alpha/beta fold hydrolase [Sinorhizobium meliloti]|uniref:alpha/beta fold hydrolase n=2 Tax=Rhizobium meliloti TaxID=382 RepID=UPI000B5A8BA0|nr:alpha/beta hydrolase [Sinorhizobium meliloti]ASJ61382.1 alpha/beta hydrolase [Sinorhizobium meliloti]MCK3785576.1 alpha/beta hydrolase [Sinorhizobium meliloti]MCK3791702.1 alpha/beta hydrolase [Sinorhizobium meliloti]MCK3797167.1 alpha/beta hydrolase [Sinorhizobium meliloti]MDW9774089.1 alpha/beta fold hydrolase [Sinorhizobium meliloti]